MSKLTNTERIERKKVELETAKKQLAATQAKIARLNKEIAELENFEILSLSKELNKPSSEIRSLLLELIEKKSAVEQIKTPIENEK